MLVAKPCRVGSPEPGMSQSDCGSPCLVFSHPIGLTGPDPKRPPNTPPAGAHGLVAACAGLAPANVATICPAASARAVARTRVFFILPPALQIAGSLA